MRKNIRFQILDIRFQTRELCSNWRSILDFRLQVLDFVFKILDFRNFVPLSAVEVPNTSCSKAVSRFQLTDLNFRQFLLRFILFPLWGLGGMGLGGFAQVFPVQMTPVFTSPYSNKISDYATSLDTRFQLIVNPTDIAINSRQVRLKMYISGNGIEAQTSDFTTGINPIFINGGEIQTLTNVDLAGLFRLENLQGLSNVQYANPLPEGSYSFCFEMYDFVTNQKISRKSCANLYLILNDPPILNIPARNEQIVVSEFPNILFTWTPRSINATNVSYRFELKLLQDPSVDPQFGFAISPTVLDETQFGTTLLYNDSKPALISGKRYAWRVRAISTGGLSENSVFKNDGYSEIFWFTYASNCPAPMMVFSEIVGSKSVKITWQSNIQNTKYQVQYRKRNLAGAEWFSTYTLNTQTTITNLDVATDYEFRVGATCEPTADPSVPYTFSGINNFSTPAAGATTTSAYSCGLNPATNITNTALLPNLIESETFFANDFPVKVLEVTGSNGIYSGNGFIIVPYLAETRIKVSFENISINTDYKLIEGQVLTTYNPSWNNVFDIDPVIVQIFGDQSGTQNTEDPGVDDTAENDTNDNQDGNTNTGLNTGNSSTTGTGNTNPDGSTNNNNDPNTGNTTTTGNTTDNSNSTANNSTSGTNTTGNDYYIEYKGQKFFNGGKIKIPYKRFMMETFEMKTLATDAKVDFTIHEPGKQEMWRGYTGYTAKTSIPIEDNSSNLVNLLNLDLQSKAINVTGEPKVRVAVEKVVKPFEFTKLEAVDNSNLKRIANAGETLYYVKKDLPSPQYKKTKFNVTISPERELIDIPHEKIKWKFNNIDLLTNNGSKDLTVNINNDKTNTKATITTGSPNLETKNVNVKWIKGYSTNIDYFNKFSKVASFLQVFNQFSSKFGDFIPCEVNILTDLNALKAAKKVGFNIGTYNEEDKLNRGVNDVLFTKFVLQTNNLASLKCKKAIGFMNLSLGDLFFSLEAGSTIDFNYRLKTNNVTQIQTTQPIIEGSITITPKIGFETNADLAQYIYATVNVNTKAGVKSQYPYNGDANKIGMFMFIDRTVLNIGGHIDTFLTGREQFNFNYMIYDSRWESEDKLIIDFKNGEIDVE